MTIPAMFALLQEVEEAFMEYQYLYPYIYLDGYERAIEDIRNALKEKANAEILHTA